MLEVIYRIYQVAENDNFLEEDEMNNRNFYDSISSTKNIEFTMDCLICETRDAFKDIIRDMYGKDIRFAYSKKLQPGDVYCIIIGDTATIRKNILIVLSLNVIAATQKFLALLIQRYKSMAGTLTNY